MSNIMKSEHEIYFRGSPYSKLWNSKVKKKEVISEMPVVDILNEKSMYHPKNTHLLKMKGNIFGETSSDDMFTTDSENEVGFYSYVSMNSGVYSKNMYQTIK